MHKIFVDERGQKFTGFTGIYTVRGPVSTNLFVSTNRFPTALVHFPFSILCYFKGGAGRISGGKFLLMNFELLTFLCK